MSEQWDPEELMREARIVKAPGVGQTPGCVPAARVRRGQDRDRMYEDWARTLWRQEQALTQRAEVQDVWRRLLVVWTVVLVIWSAWAGWRW